MSLTSVPVACVASKVAQPLVKTIVFGVFKRNVRGRVAAEAAVIYSDGWRGYDALVDVGCAKHLRVDHGSNQFVRGTTHVNGNEGFWSFAKRRFQKFTGSL